MRHILLIIFFLLSTSPSWAEVVLTVTTEHYSVLGTTKTTIMRHMQRRSPYKQGQSFVPAYTGTDMSYRYVMIQKGDRCSMQEVKVFLNLTYMYPKLAQHQSSSIRWWWRDIIKEYTIHEEIHGAISTRWAHELDRELRSLKDLPCSSAKEIVETRAKTIYDKMRDEQESYDRITNHGQQQYKYKGPDN